MDKLADDRSDDPRGRAGREFEIGVISGYIEIEDGGNGCLSDTHAWFKGFRSQTQQRFVRTLRVTGYQLTLIAPDPSRSCAVFGVVLSCSVERMTEAGSLRWSI